MKSSQLLLLVGLVLLSALVSIPARVMAEPAVLTEAQIEGIRKTCSESKKQLDTVHASDGLIRVNLAQEYENISSRLMAPLNSRIALNGLDGVALSRTTVTFNSELSEFKEAYRLYDESMSEAISTNCTEDPITYYTRIENTRRLRAELAKKVDNLNSYLTKYSKEFDNFSRKVQREGES